MLPSFSPPHTSQRQDQSSPLADRTANAANTQLGSASKFAKDEINYGSLQDVANDLQTCVRPVHEMRQALYNALCSIAREVYSDDLIHLHLPPANASGVMVRTFAQDVIEYLRRKGDGKTANMANLLTQLQNTLRKYDNRLPVNERGAVIASSTSMKNNNTDKEEEKEEVVRYG